MALLSSRGIDTQSLQARGEQRRSIYFNNDRDIPRARCKATLGIRIFSTPSAIRNYHQIGSRIFGRIKAHKANLFSKKPWSESGAFLYPRNEKLIHGQRCIPRECGAAKAMRTIRRRLEFALSAGTKAMDLHQLSHALFASMNAMRRKLTPDTWPA
jgi:hypothetical protein